MFENKSEQTLGVRNISQPRAKNNLSMVDNRRLFANQKTNMVTIQCGKKKTWAPRNRSQAEIDRDNLIVINNAKINDALFKIFLVPPFKLISNTALQDVNLNQYGQNVVRELFEGYCIDEKHTQKKSGYTSTWIAKNIADRACSEINKYMHLLGDIFLSLISSDIPAPIPLNVVKLTTYKEQLAFIYDGVLYGAVHSSESLMSRQIYPVIGKGVEYQYSETDNLSLGLCKFLDKERIADSMYSFEGLIDLARKKFPNVPEATIRSAVEAKINSKEFDIQYFADGLDSLIKPLQHE